MFGNVLVPLDGPESVRSSMRQQVAKGIDGV
jgi:hypothetical protein